MDKYCKHQISISDKGIYRNGIRYFSELSILYPEDLYRAMGCNYMKFFKMDLLSKWAWVSTELLLKECDEFVYKNLSPEKIAVVLATESGCIDVDKKYLTTTTTTIASPALFVYTLSNIMLGEISIRHGFKGEQMCLIQPQDHYSNEVDFWRDQIVKQGMEGIVSGFVEATAHHFFIELYWHTNG